MKKSFLIAMGLSTLLDFIGLILLLSALGTIPGLTVSQGLGYSLAAVCFVLGFAASLLGVLSNRR